MDCGEAELAKFLRSPIFFNNYHSVRLNANFAKKMFLLAWFLAKMLQPKIKQIATKQHLDYCWRPLIIDHWSPKNLVPGFQRSLSLCLPVTYFNISNDISQKIFLENEIKFTGKWKQEMYTNRVLAEPVVKKMRNSVKIAQPERNKNFSGIMDTLVCWSHQNQDTAPS